MVEIKVCKTCNKEWQSNNAEINVVNCKKCRTPYGRKDRGIADNINQIKNKDNKKLVQTYIDEQIANGFALKPISSKLYTIVKIVNDLNKPIKKVTKADLTFLLKSQSYNKKYYKKMVKQLGRLWDWDINWISTKKSVEELRNERPKITLTESQAIEVIKKTDDLMDRAILELLADNPFRPKDLENLRVKDINLTDNGLVLSFRSKTKSGTRDILLQNSRVAFMKFWENHPYKDNDNAPVFYSKSKNSYGNPLLWGGFNGRLRNIVARTNLPDRVKNNITLYTWRRSVATWRLSDPDYSPKEVMRMGGWGSIRMLDVYGKVTDDMVNKKKVVLDAKQRKDKALIEKLKEQSKKDSVLAKIMNKYGLLKEADKMELLGTKKCFRCGEENLCDSEFCSRCFIPLKQKYIDMKERIISKAVLKQMPINKDLIKDILKEMINKGEIKI